MLPSDQPELFLSRIRLFKRHYQKVKPVFDCLQNAGAFSYHLEANESGMKTRVGITDEKLAARFVVMMPRLMLESSPIQAMAIWRGLKSNFANDLSEAHVSAVEKRFPRDDGDTVAVILNGQNTSRAQIFEALARGEYFGDDEAAMELLRPFAKQNGPLFWFQFFSYLQDHFIAAMSIFSTILLLEKSAAWQPMLEAKRSANDCIYCRGTSGQFTSEEHPWPEAFYNEDVVLPVGWVCDDCNSGVLSDLDQEFAGFRGFAVARVLFGLYNKDGSLPRAEMNGFVIERLKPREIRIYKKEGTQLRRIGANEHANLSWKGRFSYDFVRSLYKIGLGMLAYRRGRDFVFDPCFDAARSFIRDEKENSGTLIYGGKDFQPDLGCVIDERFPSIVGIKVYGTVFLIDLADQDLDIPDEAAELEFHSVLIDSLPRKKKRRAKRSTAGADGVTL